jgi:apolipoprotein N-acyltransferase
MRKNILLAMLCGVCAALALPPFFYLPLAIIAFSGLYLLLTKAENLKQSFWIGWSFGFAHHVVGLYWISNALLTDPARFGWMIPFAISLIPAALAIYIGLVAVAFKRFFKPQIGIVLFATLWVIGEWLRAHLFTGFPWNLIGYAWNITDSTMQIASVIGIYGLSYLLILAATAPVLLLQKKWALPAICSLLIPLCMLWFGADRLQHANQKNTTLPIHIVQANISQNHKWDEARMADGLMLYLKLSRRAPSGSVIVWPETAVPYFLHEDERIQKMIAQMIGSKTLITGSLRIQRLGEDDFNLWNSLEVMQKGEIAGFYNKSRLVPFGEYVPLRALLPFVEKITHGSKDFSRGEGATVTTVPEVPSFEPLICYEVIYPDYSPKTGQARWLINVTNDAWFGLSSGPHQHFEMARMRAVEQGLPIVRAANTGISGIVDAYGRVQLSLTLGEQGVIDGFLPPPSLKTTTYSLYGDLVIGLLMFVGIILTISFQKINKLTKLD